MKEAASQRLIERVKQFRSQSIGISAEDVARIPLTAEVISDIADCLSSPNISDLKWGLWFVNGILDSRPPRQFLKRLLSRVPEWLRHSDWDIRDEALEIFIRLRDNHKNYRDVMLHMLQDPDNQVRWHVLRNYKSFLTREDIPVLLTFQHDNYMTETEMGSPLIYAIRNDALVAIENLCGELFRKSEKVEPGSSDRMVYWWDWKPFLDWWGKRQAK